MIACIFAIVTTTNATQNTSLPIFREVTTNRIFEDTQKNNEKNYPLLQSKKLIWKEELLTRMILFIWEIY